MLQMAKKLSCVLIALALPVLTGGCAPKPLPRVDVELGGVSSVALQPVVFRGAEPDVFCPTDIGWELRNQLRIGLQEKGYRVISVSEKHRVYGEANPLATENPARLVELSPQEAGAVAILWVDQLTEFGFCDNSRYRYLTLTGTFALIATQDQRTLWQETVQAGETIGLGDPAFSAARELARKTVGRLPATGR